MCPGSIDVTFGKRANKGALQGGGLARRDTDGSDIRCRQAFERAGGEQELVAAAGPGKLGLAHIRHTSADQLPG